MLMLESAKTYEVVNSATKSAITWVSLICKADA
jgi:hypothetical protein